MTDENNMCYAIVPCAYGCEECGDSTLLISGEEGKRGMLIRMEGYGDIASRNHMSQVGHGVPILVESRHGVPFLVVWADINREDPTHTISLAGAAEILREVDEEHPRCDKCGHRT